MVKVKYIGENDREIDLIKGKTYDCTGISKGVIKWLIVFDESGEDYCYPPYLFELIKEDWQNEEDRNLAKSIQVQIEESTFRHNEKNK